MLNAACKNQSTLKHIKMQFFKNCIAGKLHSRKLNTCSFFLCSACKILPSLLHHQETHLPAFSSLCNAIFPKQKTLFDFFSSRRASNSGQGLGFFQNNLVIGYRSCHSLHYTALMLPIGQPGEKGEVFVQLSCKTPSAANRLSLLDSCNAAKGGPTATTSGRSRKCSPVHVLL